MKILLLIDSLVSGGRERRLIELIKGLMVYDEVQLNLVVFSEKIHYQEVFKLGIPVTVIKRVPKRNPLTFYRLFKLCKRWDPDLIHSWGTMSAIFAIPTCILLRIKLINGNITDATKNMSFFHEELFRARLTFPFSTAIIGNSQAGLEAYKVSSRKGICIYNGFNFERISNLKDKNEIRKKFNINSKKVVGMVGGFFDRKDYETYINAALGVLSQRKDVTFVAVGEGPNLAKYKAMIPSEYDSSFIFTGAQKDVESIINIFDIGVLATNSKVHGEGISNAILEYMALGKPVVATKGGGTNEIIVHNNTGILIEPHSLEVMANKILYLLKNPKESIVMGQEGKKRIGNFFSMDKMTNSYYELYQHLMF